MQLCIRLTPCRLENFVTIHDNKRKHSCALDTHSSGHLYYNVVDHPEFILNSALKYATSTCSLFLDLEIAITKS